MVKAMASVSRGTEEANGSGVPLTTSINDGPWVASEPVERDVMDVAIDFMDEYAEVFEELAT